MIDDAFVFDGVAHPFNFEQKNAFGGPGEMFARHLYAFHATLTPEGEEHVAKRKILGESLLRLHGMDVESTKAKLSRTG